MINECAIERIKLKGPFVTFEVILNYMINLCINNVSIHAFIVLMKGLEYKQKKIFKKIFLHIKGLM